MTAMTITEPTDAQYAAWTEEAWWNQILDDMATGTVPTTTVRDYSTLDHFVDGNEYVAHVPFADDDDEPWKYAAKVQDVIHGRLSRGEHIPALIERLSGRLSLNMMAVYLTANGIAAEAVNTGGGCHNVVIMLTDGDEVSVSDTEDGAVGDPNAVDIDAWSVILYMLDKDPVVIAENVATPADVLAVLHKNFDGMFWGG